MTSGSVELSTGCRAPTVRARATDYLTDGRRAGGPTSTQCSTLRVRGRQRRRLEPPAWSSSAAALACRQGDLQVVSTVNSGNVTAEVVNLASVGNAKLRLEYGLGEEELEACSCSRRTSSSPKVVTTSEITSRRPRPPLQEVFDAVMPPVVQRARSARWASSRRTCKRRARRARRCAGRSRTRSGGTWSRLTWLACSGASVRSCRRGLKRWRRRSRS